MSDRIGYWRNLADRIRLTTVLWALMLPAIAGLIIFTYVPNIQSVRYAFYHWDGSMTEEWRGVENFVVAFTSDPLFWQSFLIIAILLAANLVKMWPSIFAAIVLHRLRSSRAQHLYRILFVIPMVIPALVGLLLWKSFFNANIGIFNGFLRATGLMDVLAWLDTRWPAFAGLMSNSVLRWDDSMPLLANIATGPFKLIPIVFGGVWGLVLWGVWVLLFARGARPLLRLWLLAPLFLGLSLVWGADRSGGGAVIGAAAARGCILIPAAWMLCTWLRSLEIHSAVKRIRWIAWLSIGSGLLLALSTEFWTAPTNAFDYGRPAWIGDGQLILPAVILWGFPWIGSVGVLIYLAGLSGISQEVYEAAELDGVGFWGKIFRIEVPLIMTQVRINLIFMTIATLGEFGFFLILLGPGGGPDNAGLTPGLYMYQQAFMSSRMGYACALGLIMAAIILYITVIYQKHLRVEK